MKQLRYFLPFLLLAGVACVQAQPIVKINSGSSSTECDVTNPPAGDPIFRLDTSGNVLITGTLSGQGCGGSTTTTNLNATFTPLNPAPSPLLVSPSSINAGTGTGSSANATYTAYFASSCSVTSSSGTVTPAGSGACPALTISNAACTGSGSQLSCSGNGTVTEPTTLASGITSCGYTLTATCNPGAVASTANLSVVPSGGGTGGGGTSCPNLAPIGTGTAGQYWSKVLTTSVKFGDGTVKSGVDATSYTSVWDYPGTSVPWPGSQGLTTRPNAGVNQYFAEGFTVPTDGSVSGVVTWAFSGSGINTNMSLAMSACPGDFGQTGTVITSGCKVNQNNSSSGLKVVVNSSQQGSYCTLTPGQTYYLNVLPMANLPVGDVSTSTCSGTCTPWLGRN